MSGTVAITVTGGVGPKGDDGAGGVATVNGLTGNLQVIAGNNVLVAAGGTTVSITSTASGNVASVNGLTGTIVLTHTSLTAAAAVHTHSTSDVTGFAAAASSAAPVQSVNGRTGAVALVTTDLTAAAAVHTHSTADITSFAAAAASAAPVQSVNGRTGTITLQAIDVTAAGTAVLTSLNGLTGAAQIVAGSNITVSVGGTTVNITSTASGSGGVASVNGITSAMQIIAGTGIAVAAGGTTVSVATNVVTASPSAISASQNNYDPGSGDIFRLSSSSTNTLNITGLATASMSKQSLLINVSTHTSSVLALKHQNTDSTATQRIISPWAGDVVLSPNGGAAVVVYDDTDSRWRVI